MLDAPIPADEAQRLAALQHYCVLDTLPEPAFDRLTHVLQHVLGIPTVLVSLVDADRQWFKSRIGLDATETPRNISFCGHAVFQRKMLIVPNACLDPRFCDNPLVTGPLGLRFYAGVPLITADGFALGTLCAIDYVPRPTPTDAQLEVMARLADAVVAALELRAAAQAQAARARLSQVLSRVAATAHHAADMAAALKPVLAELCAYTGAAVGHVYLQAEEQTEVFVSSGVWHLADETRFAAFRACVQAFSTGAEDDLHQRVVHDSEPLFIADLSAENGPRARSAAMAGLQSLLAFPIPSGSQVCGIVECYSDVHDVRGVPEPDHITVAEYVCVQLGRLAERERIARLKSEFVSTVSHELRTPLTSIAGALELLDGGALGELSAGAKEMISIAHHNSQRLIRLVNDILDIEKIESGRMSFELEPQDLMPLIKRATAETAAYAQCLDVRIEIHSALAGAVDDAVALVDADRFIQVMTNLLSNAAKFSPCGTAVSVTLAQYNGRLRIAVADRGPGIPPAFRARIFEKFAQADNTDERQLAGTGLGLAIVKNIVERLGGAVSFETETGHGTSFYVDLPEWHAIPEAAPCPKPQSRLAQADDRAMK